MSILIDKNTTYKCEISGNYMFDELRNNKIFTQDKTGKSKLIFYYTERDFESMSKIIEDASIINSVNGKPLLRSSVLLKLIFQNYIKRIIIKSEEEEIEFTISNDLISKIHYDYVKLISKKWLEITHRT